MPLFIGLFVETERLLAIGLVWNDGLCAALFQALSQISTIVGFITEKFLCCFASTDQTFRNRTVMRFAAGQENGKKTAFSICDCVDFRIAPTARASNRLILLPPFPPDAERCALICVESII